LITFQDSKYPETLANALNKMSFYTEIQNLDIPGKFGLQMNFEAPLRII